MNKVPLKKKNKPENKNIPVDDFRMVRIIIEVPMHCENITEDAIVDELSGIATTFEWDSTFPDWIEALEGPLSEEDLLNYNEHEMFDRMGNAYVINKGKIERYL